MWSGNEADCTLSIVYAPVLTWQLTVLGSCQGIPLPLRGVRVWGGGGGGVGCMCWEGGVGSFDATSIIIS